MTPPTYEEAKKKQRIYLPMIQMGKSQIVREAIMKMMQKEKTNERLR